MADVVMPPGGAAVMKAYQSVDLGEGHASAEPVDFSSMVSRALQGAVEAGHEADHLSVKALNGRGDLTQVVTAVSKAELALQTTVALRDRVLSAYQDIIKMPI